MPVLFFCSLLTDGVNKQKKMLRLHSQRFKFSVFKAQLFHQLLLFLQVQTTILQRSNLSVMSIPIHWRPKVRQDMKSSLSDVLTNILILDRQATGSKRKKAQHTDIKTSHILQHDFSACLFFFHGKYSA